MNIEKIYLDEAVEEAPLSRRVLERLKGVPVEKIRDRDRFLKETQSFSLTQGKKNLWLTEFKGPLLKPCPGTDRNYLCCNYWVINAQTNCPLDCTYCILQTYLNQPLLTLYANLEEVSEEIETLAASRPRRLFRIGTGELTDSLALNPFTGITEDLTRRVRAKNVLLEFKTKTDFVGHLPSLSRRNGVLSWSVNPPEIIREEEFKSAPLEARLEAAQRAVAKGYRIGFHLDPILEIPEWEKSYQGLIRELTRSVPEKDVAWISLGSLRFPPALKGVIDERFPKSRIATGELVSGLDGKMRYFRPVRTSMYQKTYAWMREQWKEVFIYFCMENDVVWKEVMGFSPEDNGHLDCLFHESLYHRFPDLELSKPERHDYGSNN